MFQVLFLPDTSGWEYVLHDVDGIVAAFGTRPGDAVLVTSQQVPMDEQEQAAAASLRSWVGQQVQKDSVVDQRAGTGERTRVIWLRPATAGHQELWDLDLQAVD